MPRLLIVVNHAAYFLSHRLPIALAAQRSGYDVHIATGPGPADPEVVAQGLTHHPLPLSRSGLRPLDELRSMLAIRRLFQTVKPDVVHLVTIKPVIYGGIMSRAARVPGVVSAVPGLGFVFLRTGPVGWVVRKIAAKLYREAFRRKNLRVIFQNEADRATICAATGLPLAKTVLIPGSGVDLSQYAPRERSDARPVVVMAARLLRDKGVHEYIDAARLLRERGSPARFQLAGSPDPGNPASVSEADLAAWRADGIVELLGERNDIAEVFARADVVVLPSYREGLPRVLVEAAASGRAVVTSDVPGCRDAIIPGVTGLLVPARVVAPLADAIQSLLADPERRKQMGREGRKLAERLFSITRVVEAHLDIYRELLDSEMAAADATHTS
jgi:glycosyltransferase involved in cell wall biosynthesis